MNGKTIGLAAALVTSQLLVRDWNADGRPDLVMGAGDGFFYCLRHEAK